jgi:hypothetical protein
VAGTLESVAMCWSEYMKRISLAALVVLVAAPLAHAATQTATTCSKADVDAAISRAVDGDTVRIPAGSCSWSSSVSTTKGISIIGAGVGSTNIANGGFHMDAPSGKVWRVSGLTVTGTGGVSVEGYAKGWRVDHIKFDNVSGFAAGRIIWVNPSEGGYTTGLVDHVEFNAPKSIQVHVREQRGGGNDSYMRPLGLGGTDAVYIEDSIFYHPTLNTSSPVTDCEGGGRFVFRHNVVTNAYMEMHDAIIDQLRSCRKWEFYDNTFRLTGAGGSPAGNLQGQCALIAMRGGTGVTFNNKFEQLPDCGAMLLDLYRTYQTAGDPWNARCSTSTGKACLNSATAMPQSCSSDANCGGTAGSCVSIDGPGASPSGYPCRDQIGTDGNAPQVSAPALFWNNTYNGQQVAPDVNTGGAYLAKGRDFCDGGATKPASCNGVTTTYQPLAYPHPLAIDAPRPKPPTINVGQ